LRTLAPLAENRGDQKDFPKLFPIVVGFLKLFSVSVFLKEYSRILFSTRFAIFHADCSMKKIQTAWKINGDHCDQKDFPKRFPIVVLQSTK
jgi:hypothetical protein